MREFHSVQEKILDRALFLIGEKGSYDVPIRDITHAAGVNVNAVNYYFGSKDNMLDQMEAFFIQNYLSAYAVLEQELEDEQKLLLWANEIMEYTLQYPGIQILLRDCQKPGRNGRMSRFLKEKSGSYNQKVDQLLKRVFNTDEKHLHLIRILFHSAILYPASFGTDFHFGLEEIKDRDFRLRYLTFTIDTIKKGLLGHEV